MRLHKVYARFYRSLNHDYLRSSAEKYDPDPWDDTPDGTDYPFVRLRLEPDVTTVVGGNESGKSQVLRAINAALTGDGFDRSDFCRYSPFFGVDADMVLPEFGAVFIDLTDDEVAIVEKMTGTSDLGKVSRLALFRMNMKYKVRAYVEVDGKWSAQMNVVTPTLVKDLGVPAITVIDPEIPLPDAVPLEYLITGRPSKAVGRGMVSSVYEKFRKHGGWFTDEAAVTAAAAQIAHEFAGSATSEEVDPQTLKQYKLAADLLFKVAKVERDQVKELQAALKEKTGYAASLLGSFNDKIAKSLNFPHWWSQDSQFELVVSALEFELRFEIRDRTGKSYSFDERSDGLKYFLSYFVQYLAHGPPPDAKAEVLLMDEPDRWLSSSAQQDLLRIFEDFAHPQDRERRAVQVVYVTHSPFLIDKNDARRIRVLEKGEFDEGTRVVASVAANHYEPLRSAFGSFVAETTFISGCNIVVEGPSDQILIAGMTRWLKRERVAERDRLDLNAITIVPSGGTQHVPYMVYLARGRDVEKPAVVVLLDSDKDANTAYAELKAGGPKGKPLVRDTFILQIGDEALNVPVDNPDGRVAIEDLLPVNIAIDAAARYCREFVPSVDVHALTLAAESVFPGQGSGKQGTAKSLEIAIAKASKNADFKLAKIGLARCVVEILMGEDNETQGRLVTPADLDAARASFGKLLSVLARLQRDAVREGDVQRISTRINRIKREFLRKQKGVASREDVLDLIEQIDTQLDQSIEADRVRERMSGWRAQFKLTEDPREEIEDFLELTKAVNTVAYQAVRESEGAK